MVVVATILNYIPSWSKSPKPKLRQSANSIIKKVQTVEEKKQDLLGQRHHYFTGKCDWCGDSTAKVCQLYDSKLEIEGTVRLAQVCDDCQSEYEL